MSRLIPLVLKPVPNTNSSPKTPRADRQRTAPISLFLRPSSPNTYQHNRKKIHSPPPIPVRSPRRRLPVAHSPKKRVSGTAISKTVSLSATSIASTKLTKVIEEVDKEEIEDSQGAMDEVRRSYIRGNYKNCSSLCTSLLARPGTNRHPLHEIYLTFYLATSLELQSKSLPVAQRLSILYTAKDHYNTTSKLISSSLGSNRDSFQSVTSTPPTTPISNRSSSVYSPTSSISSIDSWSTSPKAVCLPTTPTKIPVTKLPRPRTGINTTPESRPQLSISIPSSQPRLSGVTSHLSSLAKQLDHHISNIDSEIKSLQAPSTTPALQAGWLPGFTSGEMRTLERQVKMQELKMRPRKRFDASRTKRLCEDALEELHL